MDVGRVIFLFLFGSLKKITFLITDSKLWHGNKNWRQDMLKSNREWHGEIITVKLLLLSMYKFCHFTSIHFFWKCYMHKVAWDFRCILIFPMMILMSVGQKNCITDLINAWNSLAHATKNQTQKWDQQGVIAKVIGLIAAWQD